VWIPFIEDEHSTERSLVNEENVVDLLDFKTGAGQFMQNPLVKAEVICYNRNKYIKKCWCLLMLTRFNPKRDWINRALIKKEEKSMYNYLFAGSGLFGCVFAHETKKCG
jgi:hypothetical protein